MAHSIPGLTEHLPVDTKHAVARWERWIQRESASTFIAIDDDQIVGFAALHAIREVPDGKTIGELNAMYVLPKYQQLGWGRTLWQSCLVEAEQREWPDVVLWVLESNEPAKGFYSSLGFVPDGGQRVFSESTSTVTYEQRFRFREKGVGRAL